MPQPPDLDAQELFDRELDDCEQNGLEFSVERLCDAHPEHREQLEVLYAEWQQFQDFAAGVRGEYGVRDGELLDTSSAASDHFQRMKDRSGARSYQALGELGRGGMGVVHKVWDQDLQRELAMKVMRQRGGSTPSRPSGANLSRFLAEAQITGQLEHPGVVPVHEVGVNENNEPYFTMSMVKGRDLSKIFRLAWKKEEGWSQTRVVRILLQACHTLAYAHSKKVLHRDLKPSNIMVGRFGEVFVMDWGLARASGAGDPDLDSRSSVVQTVRDGNPEEDSGSRGLTLEGVVVGTPAYMSPEQAAGKQSSLGPHSDIYSVGAMLYELVTGRPPYGAGENTNAEQIVAAIKKGPPPPIHTLTRSCPPELQAICDKAMARDPADRYVDMAEMAEDLTAYIEDRVVRSHRTGALAELQKWTRRNRLVAASLLAVVVIALASLGALLTFEKRTNREISAARAETLKETAVLESVVDWIERMFQLSDPSSSRGNVVTARELIDRIAVDFDSEVQDPEVRARLAEQLARLYLGLGLASQAQPFAEIVVRTREQELASNDPRLLRPKLLLAQSMMRQGQFDASDQLLDEIEPLSRSPGAEAHQRIDYLSMRAAAYQVTQRLESARELMEQALDEAKGVLPDEDPELIRLRSNLGVTLQNMGRFEEAEPMLREAYEVRKRLLGEDHPDTLLSLGNLGYVNQSLGRVDAAQEAFRTVFELSRRVLGLGHPQTIQAATNLATSYQNQGEYEQARQILEENRALAEAQLLPNDPVRLRVQSRLANLYRNTGRSRSARLLWEEVLEERSQQLGEDDPLLLEPLSALADLYRQEGNTAGAEELLTRALRIQRQQVGNPATLLINILNTLGQVYIDLREYGKADLMLTEALEVSHEQLGEGNQFTVRATFQLGSLRQLQDDHEAAEELLYRAADLAREHLPRSSHVRWTALHYLANYLGGHGRAAEGLDLVEEILEDASPDYFSYPVYKKLQATLEERLERGDTDG